MQCITIWCYWTLAGTYRGAGAAQRGSSNASQVGLLMVTVVACCYDTADAKRYNKMYFLGYFRVISVS